MKRIKKTNETKHCKDQNHSSFQHPNRTNCFTHFVPISSAFTLRGIPRPCPLPNIPSPPNAPYATGSFASAFAASPSPSASFSAAAMAFLAFSSSLSAAFLFSLALTSAKSCSACLSFSRAER